MDINGHKIEYETKNKDNFGQQEVIGYLNGDAVISLSDGALGPDQKWMWRVTSSRTVPTTLDEANAYQVLQEMCIKKAKKLDNFYRAHRALYNKYLYNVEKDEVNTLKEVHPNDEYVMYYFETFSFKYGGKARTIYNTQNISELLKNSIEIDEKEFNDLKVEKLTKEIEEMEKQLKLLKD